VLTIPLVSGIIYIYQTRGIKVKKYIDAVVIKKNLNNNYDIYNYARKPFVIIDKDGNKTHSYKVAFNHDLESAKREKARMDSNLLRINGTTKILK